MGNSSIHAQKIKNMSEEIERFSYNNSSNITQREFVERLFSSIDYVDGHSPSGKILVLDTFILNRFYKSLTEGNKALSKSRLQEKIEKIYDDDQYCYKYTFNLMQSDDRIRRENFNFYMAESLKQGMKAIQKHSSHSKINAKFHDNLEQWIQMNKTTFNEEVERLFDEFAQTDKSFWTMGDLTRWIHDCNYWFLQIEISTEVFRIPLNLHCLFAKELKTKQ